MFAKIKVFSLSIAFSLGAIANSNLLLNQKGSDLDFSRELQTQKAIKLDDPFLIQLYSSWKALGALDPKVNEWMQTIFAKNNEKALNLLPAINDSKISKLKAPAEIYLMFRLGKFQSSLGKWIDLSAHSNFLKTELGLALDHVLGANTSQILIDNGFSLTPEMSQKLTSIETIPSNVNYSLQAFKALRSGDNAVKWIGKLKTQDELRVHLAYSAILAYGKKGMLGASGKLVKKVIEPWIEKSQNADEIALYYMTLGRLLYQAGAFEQSAEYYKLIPEKSKYFLEARTESLWGYLQRRDFSKSVGELASLKLGVFSEQYYPEIFLASAIGNTMLCQFSDARESIHNFVKVNRTWAKKIEEELKKEKPSLLKENFFTQRMAKQMVSLKNEISFYKKRQRLDLVSNLEKRLSHVEAELLTEAKKQWRNRYKILDSSLYKMKFVRIELISRMKAVADGLKEQLPGQDMVKRYEAANVKGNQIVFPNDGVLWGDELFNMSADVRNQCIQGSFYGK